jgi:hypothetical protein
MVCERLREEQLGRRNLEEVRFDLGQLQRFRRLAREDYYSGFNLDRKELLTPATRPASSVLSEPSVERSLPVSFGIDRHV